MRSAILRSVEAVGPMAPIPISEARNPSAARSTPKNSGPRISGGLLSAVSYLLYLL